VEPIIVNYPEEARQQGIVGKVLLQLYIDAAGNVRKAEVVTSPFHQAVLMRFEGCR